MVCYAVTDIACLRARLAMLDMLTPRYRTHPKHKRYQSLRDTASRYADNNPHA